MLSRIIDYFVSWYNLRKLRKMQSVMSDLMDGMDTHFGAGDG